MLKNLRLLAQRIGGVTNATDQIVRYISSLGSCDSYAERIGVAAIFMDSAKRDFMRIGVHECTIGSAEYGRRVRHWER